MRLNEFLALSDEEKNNLRSLYLSDNNITDINFINNEFINLTNLKTLYLSHNNIKDITPLKNLTNLKNLYLFNNKIKDITPLTNLTNLKELHLFNNDITDITPLKNLTNCIINISYFPILYTKNPDHPLVMSYKMEEFDDNMKYQLITDLEVKLPFRENNIVYT